MQFKASLKTGAKEYEVEFEIEDEVVGHTRLTDAITKIQKLAKKPERAAAKLSEAPRAAGAPSSVPAGAK